MNVLSIENLEKTVDDKALFSSVTLGLEEGEIAGMVGFNGAGKSTFLKVLAGLIPPDAGTVAVNRNAVITLLGQSVAFCPESTIEDYLYQADHPGIRILNDYAQALKSDNSKLANQLYARIESGSLYDIEIEYKNYLSKFGIKYRSEKKMDELSGGEQKKVALARVFALRPQIMLLDEPTNHLDIRTIEILENELTGNNGSGGDDGKGDGKDEGKDEGTASSIVTGFHVTDGMYKSCMSVECGRGFAFTLPNHKAYQTITLPAGFYQFSVSFGPYSKTLESYLVVSAGAGLPDVANVSEALAYTDLANGKLTFQLAEETEVSLGVLINWTDENNWGCITIDRFSLGEIPYDEIDGNGETGIECVQPAVAEEVSVRAVRGGLYVSSDEPQLVQIYTVSIMLSPGVYIVNRQKVMVP